LQKDVLGFTGKTILVTGASGYIGAALVKELVNKSCEVVRVSRDKLDAIDGTRDIIADISTRESWSKIVSEADVIYHLAGNTSVNLANQNPKKNKKSTILPIEHLHAELIKQEKHVRIIFSSTATVYGLPTNLPVAETELPNPLTVYDRHKLIAEKKLLLLNEQTKAESVILRLANVYGASERESTASDRGILNRITKMALRGKDLSVFGNGMYIRDYIYINDVIDALLLTGSSQNIDGQIFNIGSGIGRTVKDAFEAVSKRVWEISNIRTDVQVQPWPEGADAIDFRNYVADTRRFRSATGWEALIDFESGISLMINDFYRKMKPQ
jgi:nucleoside-diphosphate-sugar epimerase